ncbi:MAG: oxidoreductase [Herbaspirillum sp.]|jgi:vanillate O-demethylase ferredoxin subunit|nr:oxidoreductase [Herbaspirillum sp.]
MSTNKIEVKVINKVLEAQDIASFELARTDGASLPPFSAGSHIDVQVKGDIVRQYSLCNHPGETHRYLIAVLRDPASRGGSIAMHDQVQIGDVISISEPKNHFPLAPAKHALLLAGGIGVTPILCMAERLAQIGADFEMHYAARSPERMAFRKRIESGAFAGRVHFHFDDGDPQQKLDVKKVLADAPADAALYVCGPSGFIDYVIGAAQAAGKPAETIHKEYFGAVLQTTADDGQFQIKLASSGAVYSVPADKTVLEVLVENGVDVPYSCEQGVCGTCLTRVLEGIPDHRDMYLSDEEQAQNAQFMPCCSRSKSTLLVLDL